MLKVKGAENLYRDPNTGAIVAGKTSEVQAHRRRRNIIKQQKTEIEELRNEVGELKSMFQYLKDNIQSK